MRNAIWQTAITCICVQHLQGHEPIAALPMWDFSRAEEMILGEHGAVLEASGLAFDVDGNLFVAGQRDLYHISASHLKPGAVQKTSIPLPTQGGAVDFEAVFIFENQVYLADENSSATAQAAQVFRAPLLRDVSYQPAWTHVELPPKNFAGLATANNRGLEGLIIRELKDGKPEFMLLDERNGGNETGWFSDIHFVRIDWPKKQFDTGTPIRLSVEPYIARHEQGHDTVESYTRRFTELFLPPKKNDDRGKYFFALESIWMDRYDKEVNPKGKKDPSALPNGEYWIWAVPFKPTLENSPRRLQQIDPRLLAKWSSKNYSLNFEGAAISPDGEFLYLCTDNGGDNTGKNTLLVRFPKLKLPESDKQRKEHVIVKRGLFKQPIDYAAKLAYPVGTSLIHLAIPPHSHANDTVELFLNGRRIGKPGVDIPIVLEGLQGVCRLKAGQYKYSFTAERGFRYTWQFRPEDFGS